VSGSGNTVIFYGGSGNAVTLAGTAGSWDTVSGNNGSIYLSGAQAWVSGGGNAVSFYSGSGNAVTISNTAGTADSVYGSNGTVNLSNAEASIVGDSNVVQSLGTTNWINLLGSFETVAFQPAIGQAAINDFGSTDKLQFSTADFGHLSVSQSGANTTITLDPANIITLINVNASSLSSSQFLFL
jgi:hypothetical protein